MFLPKGSVELSMNPVILRLIQKFFTKRVHGNFHVPSNTETNSIMLLLKGTMEISMSPVILRLIQKFFTERVHRNFHLSCHIEFINTFFL